MNKAARHEEIVIGLTGSFGSGCSYIADLILKKRGYEKVSLSDVLCRLYEKEKGINPREKKVARHELQLFGDEIREKHNDTGYLAKQVIAKIKKDSGKEGRKKWVVDSIRNPGEIRALREAFSTHFFLMGVYADKTTRWERVKGPDKYNNDWK